MARRSHKLVLVLGLAAACTKSTEPSPAPAAAREDEAPAAPQERSLVGETVEVVVVQRAYDHGNAAHRVVAGGERGMLHAGAGSQLAAAAEANDTLTLTLEQGNTDDPRLGAFVRDGVSYRVVAVDAWLQPAVTVSHDTLVGLWRVPKAGRERWTPTGTRIAPASQFTYDGARVGLRLEGKLESFESRWVTQGDAREELQYRAPSGTWVTLAALVFEGRARRFALAQTDATWPLERVRKPADGDEDDLALVPARSP